MKNFIKSNLIIISVSIFLTLVFTVIIICQFKLNTKLTDLNSKFIHLIAEANTNETRVKEISRIQQIEKTQEIKKTQGMKEKLDVIEKKIQMVSDILNVFNKRKLNIQITSDPNEWQMGSDTLTVTYVIHNLGKLSCFIKMPKMIITTENDTEGKETLVEGVDYIFQKRAFSILKLDSKEKIQYQEMIFFNGKRLSKTFNNVFDKILIKALFHARTNPSIISALPLSLREIIKEEGLSGLFELDIIKEHSILPSLLRQSR